MRLPSNNSTVVSQGPCDQPRCKSSDAKTYYSDGHTYCFSCHHYGHGEFKKVGELFMVETNKRSVNGSDLFRERLEVSPANCRDNYDWLRKYLDEDEIDTYFFYAPVSQRHVYAYHEDEEDWFYEARSANPNAIPKARQEGTKPKFVFGRYKETGIVVVVEDIVSAIKVSRQYGVMCLFGSYFSSEHASIIAKIPEVKQVVMWLDVDKYDMGMMYARTMGVLKPCMAIQSAVDPKDIPDSGIDFLIKDCNEDLEAINE